MTIDKVKELLSKQLRIEKGKINDDSNLIEDLGADSIDLVEMLLTIEENLGVNVPDEDAINLKTVRDIAEYIEAHS
ncbi:MAG: acyl carrier protein [Clostridiales bacterium]|nr:acyl carrier protein [Clostridiales bacterium]